MPQSLRRIWYWLTEPNPKIQSFENRYYAKLLAVALVVFLPAGILVSQTTPGRDKLEGWVNIIAFSVFFGCYILLRRGYFTTALAITFFGAFVRIFFSAVWFQKYESLYFLIVPFFFGAAVLPTWLMTVFLVASVIGMYIVSVFQHVSLFEDIGWRVVSITMLSGAIAVWVNWARGMMERRRRSALEASEARYREAFHRAEAEIAERKRVEADLSAALEERGVLLKEIHHRVKNNLQTVKSLLYLQSRQFDDPAILVALQDSQDRVRSMALVHELLYQTENLKRISLRHYVAQLTDSLRMAYGTHAQIHINVDEKLLLDVDTAIPCGLIVNELVSNSLKYAFPNGHGGNIWISAAENDGRITLEAADDGAGIPDDIDPAHSPSLGLKLVHSLAKQLHGTVQFTVAAGTTVTVVFDAARHPA